MAENDRQFESSEARWIRILSHPPTATPDENTVSEPTSAFIDDVPGGRMSRDCFKRRPFANRVAQAIANHPSSTSVVVALYGSWGEGKSTVLNFIEHALEQRPEVVCVRFNPWRFADESQLLEAFFATLADALGKSSKSWRERAGNIIKDYSQVVSLLAAPFIGAAALPAGTAGRAIGESLSTTSLDTQKGRIGEALRAAGMRVVVLMDDIDRLDKREVQAVFRLVKLSADFDHTAYILAFDDKMVAAALNEVYASSDGDAGRNFLEKIVTVPLRLPVASRQAFRDYCLESLAHVLAAASVRLTEDQAREFVEHYERSLEPKFHTPRVAVRFANTLAFSLPLLHGEVNPVDLMLVEGIRAFYPALYDTIRSNLDVFTGALYTTYWFSVEVAEEKTRAVLECGLEGLSVDEREAATVLLRHLFPGLGPAISVADFDAKRQVQYTRQQRVGSKHYIGRYFHFTVLDMDITDRDFEHFMHESLSLSPERVARVIRDLVGETKAAVFIGRLAARLADVPPEVALKLATAMSRCADVFPNTDGTPPFADTFAEAAWLVGELIAREPDESRRIEVTLAALSTSSLRFAEEYVAWRLRSHDRDDASAPSGHEMEQVGAAVAERVGEFAHAEIAPLFARQTRDVVRHLYLWKRWGKPFETAQYIAEMLRVHPQSVHDLLRCYAAQSGDGEVITDSECDALYDVSIGADGIDAYPVFETLRALYGWEPDRPDDFIPAGWGTYDERNARQFAGYCRVKVAEREELRVLVERNEQLMEEMEEMSAEPSDEQDTGGVRKE